MSKLKAYAYANGRMLELDGRVKSISVKGDTTKAYRTCTIDVINAINLRKHVLEFENGKEVRVLYDGNEVFRGILMQHGVDTDGNTSLVAHDYNFYLTKNSDTVNYKDVTASGILADLCGKFGIPIGAIAGTGYVLSKHIMSGTLYEIVMDALSKTQQETGKAYRLRNRNGQVELTDITQVTAIITLENEKHIVSSAYNESIEDIQTQVKLTGGDETNPFTTVATAGNAGKYGVTQHYEHIGDAKIKEPELIAKAKAMVAEKSKPKKTYQIETLGDTSVMSGSAVGVIESMTKLSGTFTVEDDTHSFGANGSYLMSLSLSKVGD